MTWREPGLAAWFRRWARLEKVAVSLYTYECRLVPGLLQSNCRLTPPGYIDGDEPFRLEYGPKP
ncbi:hypothetical protein GCM10010269_50140 [Streptomyces humidus]|uniref:Uncharacterized protein n=1 Tax=Streptomyces humidus TaxID=52259 RepID=A0A918FZ69_9ACTN|nr:hypothetical protein GCM10010269_50140 [Streptomyces humidus]